MSDFTKNKISPHWLMAIDFVTWSVIGEEGSDEFIILLGLGVIVTVQTGVIK